MREIKFRAWDKENKKIISWEDIKVYEDNSPYLSDYFNFKNTPIILMQYTGLKDKNGKEIYEGDIVYSTYYRHNIEIEDIFTMYKWFDYPESEEFEIIGNIYENPELLK